MVFGVYLLSLQKKKKKKKKLSPIYAADAHKVASKIKILTPRKHYKSFP